MTNRIISLSHRARIYPTHKFSLSFLRQNSPRDDEFDDEDDDDEDEEEMPTTGTLETPHPNDEWDDIEMPSDVKKGVLLYNFSGESTRGPGGGGDLWYREGCGNE